MLEYVKTQLTGKAYTSAQRRLVEALRKSNRSKATSTGKYIEQCVRHHIKESYDAAWGTSQQAINWLEDHVSGVQDVFAVSAASVLPVVALAKQAEAAGMWWQAALRWKACGSTKGDEQGNQNSGVEFFKLAVNASAKAVPSSGDSSGVHFTQFDLDSFELYVDGKKTTFPTRTAVEL